MNERISALLDGQVDDQAFDAVLESVKQSPETRDRWSTYCLIGDALRDEPSLETDMTAAVMQRLAGEPTVLAPVEKALPRAGQGMWQRVLPLAASIMGVAVVGWIALQGNHDDAAAPPLRVAAPPQASTIAARAVARSTDAGAEALRAYVFAHQSTAQQGAMPGVAPYVRTVAEVARGPQQ